MLHLMRESAVSDGCRRLDQQQIEGIRESCVIGHAGMQVIEGRFAIFVGTAAFRLSHRLLDREPCGDGQQARRYVGGRSAGVWIPARSGAHATA